MNDAELKDLSAQVKRLTARVEGARLGADYSAKAGLRKTVREGSEEYEASRERSVSYISCVLLSCLSSTCL